MTKNVAELLCGAAALLALAVPASASSIFATAGNLGLKKDTSNSSWRVVLPAPPSNIQWFVGDSNLAAAPLESVDGTKIPTRLWDRRSLIFRRRRWGRCRRSLVGRRLRIVMPRIRGRGRARWRRGGTATWSATATGTLGTKAGASWHSFTTAKDPWGITASDFSSVPNSTYDLFFMAGLTGADLDSADAGLGFDVSYQTGAGTEDLLDVTADSSGVHATIGTIAGLEIYLLSSPTESPSAITGAPLTAAEIQSLLASLGTTGQLSSSVLFGFELNGLPIPTQDLGSGVVAWMNVTGIVYDGADGGGSNVPEPTSFSLLAAGGILVGVGRLRRRTKR